LDEPTTGIDVESSRQIRKMIKALKAQGTTVFLTTHYIEEAERICDRIAFIAGGQIVASGTLPELMGSISHGHTIQFVTSKLAENLIDELQSNFKRSKVNIQSDNTMTMESEGRIPLLAVMSFLHAKGIEVYEAKELRPSLEDVFVKLTGIESAELKRDEKKGDRK
jgi:ABC-2 type transport system ATP-binding protein